MKPIHIATFASRFVSRSLYGSSSRYRKIESSATNAPTALCVSAVWPQKPTAPTRNMRRTSSIGSMNMHDDLKSL